jgi:hypothetical protein
MNSQWQKYVDAAKQQQPLLTTSDVEQLLQQPKAKVVVKKRWLNIKLLLFMSMLSTLFVGLMWLQQPTPTPIAKQHTMQAAGKKAQHVVIESQEKPNTATPKKGLPTSSSNVPTESPNQPTSTPTYFSFTPLASNTFPSPQQQPSEPERNYFNDRGELLLTYDELAELGIMTNGNILDYLIITDTPLTSIYDGEKKLETPIFTLHIESGGRNSLNGMTDELKGAFFTKFFAIAIEDSVTDNKYPRHSFLNTELNISRGYALDYFNELKPHIVPVAVELIYKNKTQHLVFWFKNEPDFIRALPLPIAQAVEQKYGQSKSSSYFKTIRDKYRSFKPITKSLDSLTIAQLQKKFIRLSDESLKELNIRKTKKKVKLVFWESKTKNNKTIVSKSIYKNKGNYYYFTHQVIRNLNNRKGLQKVHNSPIAITNYSMSNFNFLRNIDDSIGPFVDNPSYSFFAKLAPQLHPIFIDSNNIIWFPNSYLINKVIQTSNNHKAGVNLHKMNKLMLPTEVLAKLNITYQPDGIKIPSFDNGVQSIYSIYDNNGSTSQFNGFTFKPIEADSAQNFEIDTTNKPVNIKITNWKSIAVPVLVTDLTGIGWYQSELETDKFITKEEMDYMVKNNLSPLTYLLYINAQVKAKELLTKQLTTFVPIVLKHPSIKNTGVIAWYKPDSAFLSLLPAELSLAIKQELTAISTNNKGASCTYFEACKELGMDWEINAFPNPTENELNLTIESANEGRYRVEITDIEGKTIKELSKEIKLLSGKHQLNFNISNLAKGMYLLQVINDKQEILVKRIVKL